MVKRILLILAFVLIHPLVVWGATISGDFSTSLTSHWEMEETSSTRMDSTASNNDLTANGTGGVEYGTGIIGNGADFERTETDYLSIADASQTGLDLSGDFSVSFWVKMEADNNGQHTFMVKDSNGANTTRSYYLIYNDNGTPILQMYLFGTGYSWPTNVWGGFYTYTLTPGTWYHIVVTVDISEATNKVYLYVNGSGQGYFTKDAGDGTTSIQNSAAPFQIGYASWMGVMDGLLDEFTIWGGRILNSTEVSTIYNSGSGISYTAGAPATTYTTGVSGIDFY